MTARMCHWVIGMMFNKSAGCVSSLKASALQTCFSPTFSLFPTLTPYLFYSGAPVRVFDTRQPRGSSKGPKVFAGPMNTSLSELPVMETGEAGPPGEMTSSKLPKGTDGIMMAVQGFAGAPGGDTTTTVHAVHNIVSRNLCFCFIS